MPDEWQESDSILNNIIFFSLVAAIYIKYCAFISMALKLITLFVQLKGTY